MNVNGLTISENKSIATTFSKKRFEPINHIKIGQFTFPHRTTVKYLGMHLDQKLNWKTHVNALIKRSENAVNILRAFCNCTWGSDPNISLIFYRTLIRSIIDYGSLFYGNASNATLQKLNSIKNTAIRLCVGFLRSTPVCAIEAEVGEPPLNLRRQYLSDKLILNLLSRNSSVIPKISKLSALTLTSTFWRVKKSPNITESFLRLSGLQEVIHSSKGLNCFKAKYEAYETDIIVKVDIDFDNVPKKFINNIFQETIAKTWPNYEMIFTDGSKGKEGVGCAFYVPGSQKQKLFKLPKEASIYTAELTAIRQAMYYCLKEHRSSFIIFTDSKSSVDCLQSLRIQPKTSYLIQDILTSACELESANKSVKIAWIKGHSDIHSNEYVDELAKKAREEGIPIDNFKVPYTDFTALLKGYCHEQWQKYFSETPACTYYKNMLPRINRKPWFYRETNKNLVRIISRIRTNHALYLKHMYVMKLSNTEECICGEIADLQHLFLDCPILDSDTLISEIIQLGIQLPFNLPYLISQQRLDIYRLLYKFVIDKNLKL